MSAPAAMRVAALSPEDAAWLGRWRTCAGLEAFEAEGLVWVRGSAAQQEGWATLPAQERFHLDAAGRLTREGHRVPLRRLPEGEWLPLPRFLPVAPPASLLPAQSLLPLSWGLEPSTHFRPAALLTLPFPDFARWALRVSAVRLRDLQFACSSEEQACVRGSLLPPLPGVGWCLDGAVATPAGWAFPRGISAALVAASLQLPAGSLALIHEDASAEILPGEAFVSATRSAIRHTRDQSNAPD